MTLSHSLPVLLQQCKLPNIRCSHYCSLIGIEIEFCGNSNLENMNQLVCDCHLEWLPNFISTTSSTRPQISIEIRGSVCSDQGGLSITSDSVDFSTCTGTQIFILYMYPPHSYKCNSCRYLYAGLPQLSSKRNMQHSWGDQYLVCL